MKMLLGTVTLLVALALPLLAQVTPMSPEDQGRFNNDYARWLQDRQNNDRDDMLATEQSMQDLMRKYQIPSSTPYDEIAAQNTPPGRYDRDYDRDRGYAGQWRGQLPPDDQKEFNKEYGKWQDASAKHDQDDIDKHARKMQEIMARNNIPPNTPFDTVATAGGGGRHYDYRQFQGKFTPDDQKKFDKAYEHWLNDRRRGDRDDIAKDEGKMQELMARYNIPRDVPYDLLVSGSRGY